MAASYPNSIIVLPTHNDNTDTIFAADVNTPNAEIVAIETGLLNGFQHDLVPLTDDAKSIGNSSHRWLKVWTQDIDCDGTFTLNGVAYTSLATVLNATCNGRLTLTSGTPVTSTDVTAATTLYYTPYAGKYIALYDGVSAWVAVAFSELSIAVPATTSQMYDVFIYNSSGTATIELLAWTNDTTRATALVLQDGVYVKSGATTRRYVGSFRTTTVSGQTEDSLAKRFVWNYYNRVNRAMRVLESTASWTYTTNTYRQANGATGNQLAYVVGLAEVQVHTEVSAMASNATVDCDKAVAIGVDSTSAVATGCRFIVNNSSTAAALPLFASLDHYPAVGYHFNAWLETSRAIGTTTWYGTATQNSEVTPQQSGIAGWIQG